jgi:superfamily II DNA or RNA helicase
MDKTKIQEIALKQIDRVKRCGLGLATGVGKTLLGLKHMEKEYSPLKKFLVVAPKKTIMGEWRSEAVLFKKTQVMIITEFTTYRSLNKKNPKDYDVVYLDECHSLLDSHREFLSNYNGKILGLTGTPPKFTNSEKGKMVQEYCPIIWNYLADEAIDDKILNDYKIVVHYIELTSKPVIPVTAKFGRINFKTSEKKSYNYWNTRLDNAFTPKELNIARIQRMRVLKDFPSKEKYTRILANSIENNDKDKCLIFANTQEQADKLSTHSYHSNNIDSENNLKMFKDGEINRLSCVLQLSEGVNIPELRQGIIMHAYGNERKAQQRIGRLLRLNPEEKAIVHILCYKHTVDEKWVKAALETLDQNKIEWKDYKVNLG